MSFSKGIKIQGYLNLKGPRGFSFLGSHMGSTATPLKISALPAPRPRKFAKQPRLTDPGPLAKIFGLSWQ